MKKITFITLLLTLMFSCSSENVKESELNTEEETEHTESENTTKEINLYASKENNNLSVEIVKINKDTGNETLITTLENTHSLLYLVFDNEQNSIIGFRQMPNETNIESINLETKEIITISKSENSTGFYREIVIGKEGDLYASKENNDLSVEIVKINKDTGDETLITTLENTHSLLKLVFDDEQNSIIGFRQMPNETNIESINLETKEIITISKSENSTGFYREIIVGKEGALYASKENNNLSVEIVKINKDTGDETLITTLENTHSLLNLVFDNEQNSIIGFRQMPNETNIESINVETKEIITISKSENSTGFYRNIMTTK